MRLRHPALLSALASLHLFAGGLSPQQIQQARSASAEWYKDRWASGRSWREYFPQMSQTDQLDFLVGTARNRDYRPNRDAALVLAATDFEGALGRVLQGNDEGRLALYRLGYRSGGDATAFLGWNGRPGRPWTQGMGLHLDAGGWRFQMIPAAAFLPSAPQGNGLPDALAPAPEPTALMHLRALKPGLAKLADLAGGPNGQLLATAAAGPRAGFLATHLRRWLDSDAPGLAPLADREAWVLHYGRGGMEGTLAFLPGDLPGRSAMALSLLKLNPFSAGARARTVKLKDGTEVDAMRGSGGLLFLERRGEGVWIADRVALLEDLHKPTAHARVGERQEWGRLAAAGMGEAQVSFWLLPSAGADAANECALLRLREHPRALPAASSVTLAKAAPRDAAFSAALGAGPTDVALRALLAQDDPYEVPQPDAASGLVGDGSMLTPEQQKQRADWAAAAAKRRAGQAVMRRQIARLEALLDLRGAAFHWNGWTQAPPVAEAERARLVEWRKTGAWTAENGQRMATAPKAFGGFGEPGFTPSLALAIPVLPGKEAETEALAAKVLKDAFKGAAETKELGAVKLHRVRTAQAFAPSSAVIGSVLVLASDDQAAAQAVAGLQGQAPTLADLPGGDWGLAHLDGARLAPALQTLLRDYLSALGGQRENWWEDPQPKASGDEVSEEVASSFGPFLDLIRKQGAMDLVIRPTAGGFELRPR